MARKHNLLLAFLLSSAIAQQQHAQQHGSPREDGRALKAQTTSTTSILNPLIPNLTENKRAETYAPAAPDAAAVRAFLPAVRPDSLSASAPELSTGFKARNLQDWEVENIVLLATVDGSIHARDRSTGVELWSFDTGTPMVKTTYHRKPGADSWMFIVEPNRNGSLYVLDPGPPAVLHKVGPTVRDLVDQDDTSTWLNSPFRFTASKKKSFLTLNATDGAALRYFDNSGVSIMDTKECHTIKGLGMDEEDECESTPLITLAKTEYSVSIHDKETTEIISTIKYAEWTPDGQDYDLQSQYQHTMDNKYLYSRYDGGIFVLEYVGDKKPHDNRFVYQKSLSSPVARVFDVAKPQGTDSRGAPLVLLSQPRMPTLEMHKENNVFINRTEDNSWYALSESSYPSVTDGAKPAACYDPTLTEDLLLGQGDGFQPNHLVGVHRLAGLEKQGSKERAVPLRIDGPSPTQNHGVPPAKITSSYMSAEEGDSYSDYPYRRTIDPGPPTSPKKDSNSNNRVLIALFVGIFIMYAFQNLLDTVNITAILKRILLPGHNKTIIPVEETPRPVIANGQETILPREAVVPTGMSRSDGKGVSIETSSSYEKGDLAETSSSNQNQVVPTGTELAVAPEQNLQQTVAEASSVGAATVDAEGVDDDQDRGGDGEDGNENDSEAPSQKKSTHRGKRGKGRKKKAQDVKRQQNSQDKGKAALESVQEAVAPEIPQAVQPDGPATLQTRVSDVSNVLELSGLYVSDKVLGRGSGGTTVYEGKFGAVEVAVKRMLQEYVQVASQEVELLQQSDHHRSIIRYFHQVQDRDFLYIAVEKCQASLNDLFAEARFMDLGDSPVTAEMKTSLVQQIGFNVPAALRQLASGLEHLHSLRIIHRDLKPHNILVAYPRKNESEIRLVISDFGLCRLLPDEGSTLATTVGNAGTIGWKPPEIIGNVPTDGGRDNKDESEQSNPDILAAAAQDPDASVYSINDGTGGNVPAPGSTSGRVKRAVDIFSLGCVFFFVLTGGSHPFDSKVPEFPGFERQYNIKRNAVNFDPLQRLGAESEEPAHLIRNMISANPKHRPTADQVLHHPFFWTAKQRLDFLCDVSDHFEREERDPPSANLLILESVCGARVHGNDFLAKLDHRFVDTLGKQRKYSGDRMLDLLRALRNKKNHYDDMPDDVKARVGSLPDGYLAYWTRRFPGLVLGCYEVILRCGLEGEGRFRGYFGEERL